MSFILVGDSGQKDAEIYRRIAEDHADRLLAIYIRDVTEGDRDDEVLQIAREVRELGVPMLSLETTEPAAEHAESHGWITPAALEKVRSHIEQPTLDDREPGLVGKQGA